MIQPTSKVTPFIWLDTQAEDAAKLYVSLFPNSRIVDVARRGSAGPSGAAPVMSASFELDGASFIAFNGGAHYQQTPAFSMFAHCEDQTEVDRLWEALIADGGMASRCGWLKDRYGVSWQIVPKALGQLLSDPDAGRAQRAMQAMLKMSKIEVAALESAAAGDAR